MTGWKSELAKKVKSLITIEIYTEGMANSNLEASWETAVFESP